VTRTKTQTQTKARTKAKTKTGVSETEGMEASVQQQRTVHAPRLGDWVFTATMLAVFVACYVLAEQWPFRAALFPQIVAVTGAVLSVLKLLGLGLATFRARRTAPGAAVVPSTRAADLPAQPPSSAEESENLRTAAAAGEEQVSAEPEAPHTGLTFVDDDQEDDQSMEYVFASAGGRAWVAALAWITLFFVSFFVLGAYITVPVFALVYLKFSGKASWLAATTYAVVTGVIIYYVFRELVFIPLPDSPVPFLPF
jgi:hypothetical protein